MKYFLIGMAFIIVIQTIPTYIEYKRNKRDEEKSKRRYKIARGGFYNFVLTKEGREVTHEEDDK